MKHDILKIGYEAEQLVNALIDSTRFDLFMRGEISYREWMDVYARGNFPDWIGRSDGATRFVFWDKDSCDYVFKVDRLEDEHYCADEAKVYYYADCFGYSKYFAWCAPVYTYTWDDENGAGHFVIYAMEFCDVDEDRVTSEVSEYLDADYDIDDGEIFEYARGQWGTVAYEVESFLSSIGVYDFHSGNWGWRGGYDFVITDYVGFDGAVDFTEAARRLSS